MVTINKYDHYIFSGLLLSEKVTLDGSVDSLLAGDTSQVPDGAVAWIKGTYPRQKKSGLLLFCPKILGVSAHAHSHLNASKSDTNF